MKKIILTMVIAVAAITVSFGQQLDNKTINKAKAALRQNCDISANGNDWSYSTETVSSCFAGGFITNITFYNTTPCKPNVICIQMIVPLGTVTLGCDNEIIGTSCDENVAF